MAPRLQQASCKAPSFTTLLLSETSWDNTTIYGSNLEALYWVDTPRASYSFDSDEEMITHPSPTNVYRSGAEGRRELVASLEFYPCNRQVVRFDEERYDLDDFFSRKSKTSHKSRTVTMPAGIGKFEWSTLHGKPELYDANGRLVACHNTKPRLFSKYRLPTLEVTHSIIPCLDIVVLGWVVTMHDIAESRELGSEFELPRRPTWELRNDDPPPFTIGNQPPPFTG